MKTNEELWADLDDCDCVLCEGPKNLLDVLMLAIEEKKYRDARGKKEE